MQTIEKLNSTSFLDYQPLISITTEQSSQQHATLQPLNYIKLFKWIVYFLVGLYLFYYCFCNKKKKLTAEQKVKYKYRLVNSQVMRTYTQQDRQNMHIVINNTIANIRITDEGINKIRNKKQIQVSWMESIQQVKIFDRYNSLEPSSMFYEEQKKQIEIEREREKEEDESLLGKIFQE